MPTNYIDKIITTDNTEYVISVDLNNVQNADDLKAIEGISGTSGLLKKTASNTWTLDTSDYVTSEDIPEGASAYTGPISAVGTSSSSGSNNGFARGDHVHNITKATVDTVLGTGSGTTKFYREDGSWATPNYIANTDEKLKIAAVTSGTTYYPVVAANSTAAATRQYDATGLAYAGTNGTTSAVGTAKITLGNNTVSGTANNKKGQITLYGSTAYATTIDPGSPTAARTITLPDKAGTVALTSDIPTISYPVTSVNTKTGAVSLTASDVGAFEKLPYATGTTEAGIRPYVNQARANRLAFLPADQIIIEKTTDGGTTWTDAGYTDDQKIGLFSENGYSITIPLLNNAKSTQCGLRVTITGMKYNVPANTAETNKYNYWSSSYISSVERYFNVREWWFWLSANSDTIRPEIYCATGANPNTWTTVFNTDFGMTGWSGSDWIRSGDGKTFGGSTNQASNYWNWRIVFWSRYAEGKTSFQSTTAQSINQIRCYGDSVWVSTNNLMAKDHLYSWDNYKNATFPAKVTLGAAPTADMDAATKKYVDDNMPTVPTKTSDLTNDSGYVTTDTKNTAGSTNTSSKIYLIGATSQAANPQTYSQDTAYVGTDGYLYSNSKKTLVEQYSNSGYILNINPSVSNSSADFIVQAALDSSGNFYNTLQFGSSGFSISNDIDEKTWVSIDNNGTTPVSISGIKTPQGQYDAVNKKYVDDNIPTKTSDLTNDSGYVTTDTKNTAGSTNTTSKIFLVGATSQAANPQTYSNSKLYYTKSSGLYSEGGNDDNFSVISQSGRKIDLYVSTNNTTYTPKVTVDETGVYIGNTTASSSTITLNSGVWWSDSDNYVRVKNLIAPTSNTDAATKKYVDDSIPTNISSFTNDAGYITSADVPEGASAYTGTISAVGTTASSGTNNGFARGDHTHNITKTTIDSVLGTGSGTTKYYREDGTWVAPADTKVTNTAVTGATTYYLTGSTNSSTETNTLSKHASANIYVTSSSTGTDGYTRLTLGNNTSGTVTGGKAGEIRLYGNLTYYTDIKSGVNQPSANRTLTLPNNSGTIALTSDIPTVPTNVSAFTNDAGYITSYTDTKNTAGSTDSSSKLFLIGATTQAANPQTYSHDTAYVGTDGKLYSASKVVLVGGSNASSSVTITPTTTDVYSMTSAGSVTAGTKASFTRGTFSQGTLPTMTWAMDSTDTKKLNITFSQGTLPTHAADSFTANTPTAVTLPGRSSSAIKAWTGYSAATAAAQAFTGVTA